MTMVDHRRESTTTRPMPTRLTVVGVGDSDRDDAAINWAVNDLRNADDTDLVHVVHTYVPINIPECSWRPVVDSQGSRRTAARQAVARALQRIRAHTPQLRIDGSAVAGLPVDVLVEFSAVVDRVVVTEDLEGVSMLHQVAHRLAGTSKCPTVIVSPTFDPLAVAPLAPVTLLIDTSELPPRAIEYAYEEALRHGVSLCVAQVWSAWREIEPVTPEVVAERQLLLDEQLVRFEQRTHPVAVFSQVIRDDFDDAVRELRRASRVVVVGSNLGRLARLTGPSTHGSCPVIVVPERVQAWR